MRKLILALIAVFVICGMFNMIQAEERKSSWGRVRPQDMSYGAAVNTTTFFLPARGKSGAAYIGGDGTKDTFCIFRAPCNVIIENFALVTPDSVPDADTSATKYWQFQILKRNGATWDTLGSRNTVLTANQYKQYESWNITIVDSTAKEMSKDSLLFLVMTNTGIADSIKTWLTIPVNWYPTARQ